MQQHSLLQTKLYIPPVRPELVSRPRLTERLNEGLHRKLTLISAPAGFGKTTLVCEWVQAMRGATPPIPVAWLSLDEGDNDPVRFLAYVIAALQTTKADIGSGVLSALQSPQPPPVEAVLISLINEIAALPDSTILVLDDHHTIESSPVDDALAFLLERLPPQMHLVVATREDPHLPLARLRARGQSTELRAIDLRFTISEAAQFLTQAMGLDLSAEDIAALERRTEGWIAGLQLAALSMQERRDTSSLVRSFAGTHRYVLDYLVEEVLEQQSESVQTFLLQTAILDRLTGSLCDAVRFGTAESADRSARTASSSGPALTDQDNGQSILEMLERANLFIIPLDDERRWYRYHHLFADLLRQRLNQTQPEQLPVLHRRASEWYEQDGLIDEAIEHALRSEDFERAADMIQRYADDVWQLGEHTQLRRWLDGLPDDSILSKPHLCILHARSLFSGGPMDQVTQRLHAADRALDVSTPIESVTTLIERDQIRGPDIIKLRGRAAAVRASLVAYQGDLQGSIQYARQALNCLPKSDATWRSSAITALGDAYIRLGNVTAAYQAHSEAVEVSRAAGNAYSILLASLKLVVTLRDQGRLQQSLEVCKQQIQLADASGLLQTAVAGWLFTLWSEVLAEKNQLDRAVELAVKGVELTEAGRDVILLGSSCLCLLRVLFSGGQMDNAVGIIQKMDAYTLEHDVPPWITNQMAAWQARIWLVQGNLDSASQWAEELGLDVDGELVPLHDFDYVVLARILIAQGRLDEATRLLQRLLKPAEAGGRTSKAIEILVLQALALQAQEDTDQAITTLDKALTLAEPGGFIRIFVDEGPPMAHLLYEAATRGIAPDYARRLLAAFPIGEPEQAARSRPQVPESELVEPLSERELEVLELIAQGLTNREIASRLFLSLNTVKAHTRNIYGKLGVHNRTQATARSQAIGILPHQ
jgi:LuxR family maltose regulon positive regulatory protein